MTGALAASPQAILWATWGIAATATAGVIVRPFSWPEWVWAASGALLLVLLDLLSVQEALAGVGKGTDVYLFLVGMMLLAELARQEGLFDWLAARQPSWPAVRPRACSRSSSPWARPSPPSCPTTRPRWC